MRIRTVAAAAVAGVALGVATGPAASAATTARLEVDLPMAASAGNAVVYAGSVQVKDGGKTTCPAVVRVGSSSGRTTR